MREQSSPYRDNYRNSLWYDLLEIRDRVEHQRGNVSSARNDFSRMLSAGETVTNCDFNIASSKYVARENFRAEHNKFCRIRMLEGELEEELFRHAEDYR